MSNHHQQQRADREDRPVHVPVSGSVRVSRSGERPEIQIQPFVGYQWNTMNFSFRSRPIVLLPSVSVTGDVNDQVLFGFNGVWLQHREGPSLVAGLFVSGGLQRPNLAGMFMPSVTYGALFGGNDLLTRGPVHLASPLMFLQCTVGGGSNPMCGGGAQYTVGVDLWS